MMTQTTVAKVPLTSTPRTGSSARSGNADEAEFAASMTAVVTINVSGEDDKDKGGKTPPASQGASDSESADSSSGDVEIEIEITTLEGDDLVDNLSVTSNRGTAEISITTDGDVGVSTDGAFFSDNPEVQIGETLTFTVPEELGDVQGATITVSNLVNDQTGAESALVIAYDADGKEVLRCVIEGNESGDVTVDIDVSFSKVDFKPIDNGSWTLAGNSDFTIERIDIKTGTASENDDAGHWSDLLADFHGFFDQRNFGLQRDVQRQTIRSFAEVFQTRRPADHRDQADDVAMKQLDERHRADS